MANVLRQLASCSLMTRSMTSAACSLPITHDRKEREFYIKIGEDKAVLQYEEIEPGLLNLLHTEVPSAFRGRGVGALLAKEAFDFVADHELKTRVSCTYLIAYLKKDAGRPYLKFVTNP
ncbi:protein NATD1 [Galendromus occidentalis]|uniref:Protein NATD1 n=1 Tax=Galendromus occidentalis TaxID=34638 RepID=A0AAJ6QT73_9ACAR|nr:protein NATD1 [Galendromus occidentalis]